MINENELTIEKIQENIDQHIKDISNEFRAGFDFIKQYQKSVTIFGSSRLTPVSAHYAEASQLAARISKEVGYAVITGGGPGIMEASNKGVIEANGVSVGLNINIPHEQSINPYTNSRMKFDYFFSRKAMLTFSAEAFVFFPGGYGTFDELFGILTLVQTKKIPSVPIVLFGKDFWLPLFDFIKSNMLDKHHAIDPEDLKLFTITDSQDEVIEIIKKAPVSTWWSKMD